jgi:hypothetical protein
MGWLLDDGAHEGWPAAVLVDGREISGGGRDDALTAIGWRAACACGWRSPQLHSRAEHPSPDGYPPTDELEDSMGDEWEAHVRPLRSLSAVADAERDRARAARVLDEAVRDARRNGQSWEAIGRAVGISRQSAHERWAAHDTAL